MRTYESDFAGAWLTPPRMISPATLPAAPPTTTTYTDDGIDPPYVGAPDGAMRCDIDEPGSGVTSSLVRVYPFYSAAVSHRFRFRYKAADRAIGSSTSIIINNGNIETVNGTVHGVNKWYLRLVKGTADASKFTFLLDVNDDAGTGVNGAYGYVNGSSGTKFQAEPDTDYFIEFYVVNAASGRAGIAIYNAAGVLQGWGTATGNYGTALIGRHAIGVTSNVSANTVQTFWFSEWTIRNEALFSSEAGYDAPGVWHVEPRLYDGVSDLKMMVVSDRPAVASVEYGVSDYAQAAILEDTAVGERIHYFDLPNCAAGATYQYRVTVTDLADPTKRAVVSSNRFGSFAVRCPAALDHIGVVVAGDGQSEGTAGAYVVGERMMGLFDRTGHPIGAPCVFVRPGDCYASMYDASNDCTTELEGVRWAAVDFRELESICPFVINETESGNHDSQHKDTTVSTVDLPLFGYTEELSLGTRVSQTRVADWEFFGLPYLADWYLEAVSAKLSQTLAWLAEKLAASTARFKCVVMHYYTFGGLSADIPNVPAAIRTALLEVLTAGGATIHFSGHNHRIVAVRYTDNGHSVWMYTSPAYIFGGTYSGACVNHALSAGDIALVDSTSLLRAISATDAADTDAAAKRARGYLHLWSGKNGYSLRAVDCDNPGASPAWKSRYSRTVKVARGG